MNYTKSRLTRGYANKILNIDLGTGAITTPDLDPQVRDYFTGGRSLGLYLLHRATTATTKPAGPGKSSDSRQRPSGGDTPVPRYGQGDGGLPVTPHRHSRGLQFRRLLRRLSQVCRLRRPPGDRQGGRRRHDHHRRLQAGGHHRRHPRRRRGLRSGAGHRRPVRRGRVRQAAHRLPDHRHRRRPTPPTAASTATTTTSPSRPPRGRGSSGPSRPAGPASGR